MLSAAGASVLVNDIDHQRAEMVVDKLRHSGGLAETAIFDVSSYSQVIDVVNAHRPIDILINNAGNAGSDPWPDMKSFVDTSPEDWAPYFAVNLFGMMHCVTILSDASRVGEPKLAAYAGAKAGAAGVARSVASDTARYGITVNNISLGTMRTPLTESYWASLDENQLSQRMSTYPIRRPGVPDDVAALVGYLVSPQSEWMTGQTIPLNGGYSMAL
jgi:NAD(P)-dependent dehydrogenase (short-subunit alcohol dehydrogenase family)